MFIRSDRSRWCGGWQGLGRGVLCALFLWVGNVAAQKPAETFSHIVVAGDRLRISVVEQPDLGGVYAVAGDGTIDFGFIGRMALADLTVSQAAEKIEGLLEEKYFKDATVTVDVQEFVEGAILVMGAVKNPGSLAFGGGQIMTLMEAISLSGGLEKNAAGKEVRILRWKMGGGMERQTLTVDVQSMFETMDFRKDQYLRPRDIIFVPTLGGGEGASEYLALGDFATPGFHPYTEGLDVIRAVTRAGGVSSDARWDAARLLRPDKTGNYKVIPLDLSRLFGAADMSVNVGVMAGDILFVPSAQQVSRGQVYLLGAVARPGAVPLSMDENMTVSKIILQSGGFDKFANDSKVRVMRLAPDGSRQSLIVDVGRILRVGTFEDDVPVKNGDVIVVPEKVLGF